jgi:hypothetical protein
MSAHFPKLKLPQPRPLRAFRRSGFDPFQPADRRFVGPGSCRTQIGQSFQVPTDAFELQFQPVGRLAYIAHPSIAGAPFPPGKDRFNFTPDRTEQPVRPHRWLSFAYSSDASSIHTFKIVLQRFHQI